MLAASPAVYADASWDGLWLPDQGALEGIRRKPGPSLAGGSDGCLTALGQAYDRALIMRRKEAIMGERDVWLELLGLIDRLNRSVKEPGWYYEDRTELYEMKDRFLVELLAERPDGVELTLYYVPYLRYSASTKVRADELMRKDGRRFPFEYYLGQVEPSAEDSEDPDRALIEIVAECKGLRFSFHMPVQKMPAGFSIAGIPRKDWIPAGEFHHQQLAKAKAEYAGLMDALGKQTAE